MKSFWFLNIALSGLMLTCTTTKDSAPIPVATGIGATAANDHQPEAAEEATKFPLSPAGDMEVSKPAEASLSLSKSSQVSTNFSQVSTSPVFRTTEEEMLAENNRVRSLYGAPAQALDERLCKAAQDHADYLARTNRLEHSGANGSPLDRAQRYGFSGIVSENVAGDFSTIANAFGGWYGSTGHRETLLSRDYDVCGFGYARGTTGGRWVALYGHEGSPPPGPQINPYSLQAAPSTITYTQQYATCPGGNCGPSQGRWRIFPRRGR